MQGPLLWPCNPGMLQLCCVQICALGPGPPPGSLGPLLAKGWLSGGCFPPRPPGSIPGFLHAVPRPLLLAC